MITVIPGRCLYGGESFATVYRRALTRADVRTVHASAEIQRPCGAQLQSCPDPQLIQR
jgi:hypothetical protein